MARRFLFNLLLLQRNHLRGLLPLSCSWKPSSSFLIPTGYSFSKYLTTTSNLTKSTLETKKTHDSTSFSEFQQKKKSLSIYEKLVNKKPCLGCGVTFQNETPDKAGYLDFHKVEEHLKKISLDVLSNDPALVNINASSDPTGLEKDAFQEKSGSPSRIVCQRCHDIHHHEQTTIMSPKRLPLHLNLGSYKSSLFLQMVDTLDFPVGYFPIAHLLPKNAMYFLVFNKIDLLPLNTPPEHVHKWAEAIAEKTIQSYKTRKPENIFTISSKSGEGIPLLFEKIQEYRENFKLDNVIVVGSTNTGKSEFLNCLHRLVRHPKYATPHLTCSRIHGTTLEPIRLPLSRFAELMKLSSDEIKPHCALIETPGIASNDVLTTFLPPEWLHKWHFSQRLVPRTYKVGTNSTLFLGSLARIDILEGKGFFSAWTPPLLPVLFVHRFKANKYEVKGLPALLDPYPLVPDFEKVSSMEIAPPSIEEGEDLRTTELVFGGTGFIGISSNFSAPFLSLEIYTAGGYGFAKRDPLIPRSGDYRTIRIYPQYNMKSIFLQIPIPLENEKKTSEVELSEEKKDESVALEDSMPLMNEEEHVAAMVVEEDIKEENEQPEEEGEFGQKVIKESSH